MRIKRTISALVLLAAVPAGADVGSDLNGLFSKLGFEGNVSTPHAWQGQAAGYASGGSLYMRTQVKQIQLISLALPDLNAGCGGIDAYLGSFSFINGENFQRYVKQIMGNAAGYFFDLALQTTVPELKQAKDFLQKMAADLNSANMSSCQAAQGIVGGLWPRTQVSQQKVCQDIAGEKNIFADWAASRQGCTVGGEYDSVTDRADDSEEDQVLKNKNLIWDSLGKNRLFDGNRELKEFAMSLTGTIIFTDNGNVMPLAPLTTNEDVLRAMMNGGRAKIYHCDSADKCLNPVLTDVSISEGSSLNGQVRVLLGSIQNKAAADDPLNDKEKGFISSTRVPVLKYLSDPQSLGVANSLLWQVADYISYDILMQYVSEMMQQTRVAMAGSNYPQPAMEALQESLSLAGQSLARLQSQVQVQQDALQVVDRQMSYMRQQVSSNLLTRYQENYRFTR
ncbi:conjugal transfer pilus assembly protein TraH [Pantoea sp. Ae16]|uniref:conjugal transfer pilus assembly protein TraH n=1 Tax=Pantoea sp. Ae16 TaxID=1890373 RepID=UPI0008FD0568|nr:conjugal transfer pilus assembly protein TraH [Pantoea sp. Ae16]OIX90661.1 conjugal transfer protein TraH [Pantoea sp. Ae16]